MIKAEFSAEALRHAFDAQFALPPPGVSETKDHYLSIRLAGRAYALPIQEIAGLEAVRKIVPIPGGIGELLGLSGIRGHLVPVYDLAALLGHGPLDGTVAWLVLSRGADPAALAFVQHEGLLELPRAARMEQTTRERHLSGVLRDRKELRGILDVSSVVASLKERTRP